ncbi:hypothetical protein ACEQ8H_007873 [Pleosporales sp. CAS-2024a]
MAARRPSEPMTMANYSDLPPEQRPAYFTNGHGPTHSAPAAVPGVAYAAQGLVQYSTAAPTAVQYATTPANITYTAQPVVAPSHQPAVRHAPHSSHASIQYTATPHTAPSPQHPPPPQGPHAPHPQSDHRAPPPPPGYSAAHDERKLVEMVPGGGGGGAGHINAPHPRIDRLSVSGHRPDLQVMVPGGMPGGFPGGGGLPPPSPLLEAYHGTYQSISPMPHALMLDDDLDHLPPLDRLAPRNSRPSGRRRAHSSSRRSPSPEPRGKHKDKLALEAYRGRDSYDRAHSRDPPRKKEERRARIYDATDDALALVDSMASRTVNPDPIIDILPALSHDQMLELRAEYKRHCKVQGRGINIAKHIKLKTSGNFGKIAYVTALGKYESEGYWANYWYQSNSAKRELLIEALMGRQNFEIRDIKEAFKDKRYSDSLTRCMDKELKADKFRKAVLMALEAERQEESDVWAPEYRNRDVDTLYQAIKTRDGGESAMLGVVIMRSDAHLREVLRTYERTYQSSFARDALRKSNNLVVRISPSPSHSHNDQRLFLLQGEVIAHILNGVINRPARDAMLLHHALMDLMEPATNSQSASSKHERQQRFELLISRLVRLHWDRMHMMHVKSEYEEKYGNVVEENIGDATKGDFREFCIQLCQTGR